jgi:UDP-glucose 4-epimerase
MDDYRGKKVLITGGLGFIGSNLAIRLVEAGASVRIVDSADPTGGGNPFNIEPIRGRVEVINDDIRNLPTMREAVRDRVYIFNLAGRVSHIESMEDPFGDLQMNAVGPLTILEACRQVNPLARIVFAGTRQAYGRPESLPIVETHLLRPVDVNGVNKMAGEAFHLVYNKAYGMPTVSLRLINTYGPRQLIRHARQGFIGWFIKKAIEGDEIEIFGDGQQLRSLNYVDDVVEALLAAAVNNSVMGDFFNLGGQKPFTLESLVKILISITGKGSYRIVPFPPEKKAIDIGSVYSSPAKFTAATGWTARVSLEDGLARTVDYYRRYRTNYT